jgi:hypothetical protein
VVVPSTDCDAFFKKLVLKQSHFACFSLGFSRIHRFQYRNYLFDLTSFPDCKSNKNEKIIPRSSPDQSTLPVGSKVKQSTRPNILDVPPWKKVLKEMMRNARKGSS